MPILARGVDRAEPLAAVRLGRDGGVVDQRVQLAVEPPLDLGDRRVGVLGVREVDLDVILRAGLPRTVFRKRMPRLGEDAPPRSREALDGRMSDAAARAGQKQCPPRLVAGWHLLVFRFFSVPSLPVKQSGQLSGELRIGSSDCFAPGADVLVLTDRGAPCATARSGSSTTRPA